MIKCVITGLSEYNSAYVERFLLYLYGVIDVLDLMACSSTPMRDAMMSVMRTPSRDSKKQDDTF